MIEQLVVGHPLLLRMREHARRVYPEECCGFLIGRDEGASRTITGVEPVANRVGSERERRYVIPPDALRSLETSLEGSDSQVVGFYHSHPDHPARPSLFDRDHAWPWYTYIVLGVSQEGPGEAGAFELDGESGEFQEVPLLETTDEAASISNGGVSESS